MCYYCSSCGIKAILIGGKIIKACTCGDNITIIADINGKLKGVASVNKPY